MALVRVRVGAVAMVGVCVGAVALVRDWVGGGVSVDLELAMLGEWGYWSGGVCGSNLGLNLAKTAFFG